MARPLNITITESREELERRLQHETDARQQERLQIAVLAEARDWSRLVKRLPIC